MSAYGGDGVRFAVRLVAGVTILAIVLTAVAVMVVVNDGGDVSGREGLAIAAPVIVTVIGIATLCYLATAGTGYWPVGVLGGLVLGVTATYTVWLLWGPDFSETDTMARFHTVGLILTVTLAQFALILGVAGGRRQLRVVMWPTVAAAGAATVLATSLALTEEAATAGAVLALALLSILVALGTVVTLALALFRNRPPGQASPSVTPFIPLSR
jgi:hypothetical protein